MFATDHRAGVLLCAWLYIFAIAGCASDRPGRENGRRGDEIMICGRLFHTGAPVVLFTDPDGYDAYRTQRRFVPWAEAEFAPGGPIASPNRFGTRAHRLSAEELEIVRGGGWNLELLRENIDQFVIHYDVAGTSRSCFRALHDMRGLSVHFMIDLDGTIYQTLDVKERAWHATIANNRSVGVEIANIGAYPPDRPSPLDRWYTGDEGGTRIVLPPEIGDGGIRTEGFVGRPMVPERIRGTVNGQSLEMYDFTQEQYSSLVKLTATLCTVLPSIKCDFPREANGSVLTRTLTAEEFESYRGLLGHWHVQQNKTDPGPAFDWDRVVAGAKAAMSP